MSEYQYKVGDRIRLRLDANDSNLGEQSQKDKRNRTVYSILSMAGNDIFVDVIGSRRWFPEWVELVKPKIWVVIRE